MGLAHRRLAAPRAPHPRLAAVAVSVYVVETAEHLLAVTDSDALAHGHSAPVAMTHVGLSILLYPITGWAIVLLAWSFGRAWGGWRRVIAALGILSGLLQAFSVPATMLFPDAEMSPMFAGGGDRPGRVLGPHRAGGCAPPVRRRRPGTPSSSA